MRSTAAVTEACHRWPRTLDRQWKLLPSKAHIQKQQPLYTLMYISQALHSQWGSPLEPVSYIIVLRRNPHYTRTVQTFRTCRALTSVLAAIMSATDDCHVLYYSYMTSFNLQPTMSDLSLILSFLLPPIYFKAPNPPGVHGGSEDSEEDGENKGMVIREFTCIEHGFCMAQ